MKKTNTYYVVQHQNAKSYRWKGEWTPNLQQATRFATISEASAEIADLSVRVRYRVLADIVRVTETVEDGALKITRRSRGLVATQPFVLYDKTTKRYVGVGVYGHETTTDLRQARVFDDLGDLLLYADNDLTAVFKEPMAFNVKHADAVTDVTTEVL